MLNSCPFGLVNGLLRKRNGDPCRTQAGPKTQDPSIQEIANPRDPR